MVTRRWVSGPHRRRRRYAALSVALGVIEATLAMPRAGSLFFEMGREPAARPHRIGCCPPSALIDIAKLLG
jgi:hypothetical protein